MVGRPLNIPGNGSFSATLYENASGRPGNVIADFGIGPVQEFPTGKTFVSYPEFQYLAPHSISHSSPRQGGITG
jgi:hypothetical protein